jgi:hypothetical protein
MIFNLLMKDMNPSSPHYNENVMSSEPKRKMKVARPHSTKRKLASLVKE